MHSWFDADTIVLNPYTPLEIFLPPESNNELSNINLLMASNWDGLNSGAFALRIHPWCVSMLSAILAYPLYQADKLLTDRFRDQSAFQWFLQAQDSPLAKTQMSGKENWALVPMRWFNSLPVNNVFSKKWNWVFAYNMTVELFDNGTDKVVLDGKGPTVNPWKVMQGDMIVHFAGSMNVRDSWMGPWLRRAEALLPQWANPARQETLKIETEKFWNVTSKDRVRARAWNLEKTKNVEATASTIPGGSTKTTTTVQVVTNIAGKEVVETPTRSSTVEDEVAEPSLAKASSDGKEAVEEPEGARSTNTSMGRRSVKFTS
jgi:hypothetical protein